MHTLRKKHLLPTSLATLFLSLVAATIAEAQTGTWAAAAAGDWSNSGNWSSGTIATGAGNTANFNVGDWTGQTVNLDSDRTLGSIVAADATSGGGGLIIGGTGILTLDNGVNVPVINTNNNLTEPGGSSPFNNPLRITSVIAGSNGFEKTGPGYLSLEATNTFTGNVRLTAAASGGGNFLRLTNDNNLGATDNDIVVTANAQAVGLYASTGFNVSLNSSRNIVTSSTSGTQDFWIKTKGTGNITVNGVISGGTRLRKNDSGTATLANANTFTGNTFIEGGTLVLSGGDNRLVSGSTVTMGNATTGTTLQVDGGTQNLNGLILTSPTSAVTQTIKGSGTLALGGSSDFTVGAAITATSLDMSGLTNFTFNRAASAFQVSATGASVVNTVNLAKSGTNTITASNVRLGGGGSNLVTGQTSNIGLGQSNSITASGELVIGYFQGSGSVAFQSGLTNPSLTIRGGAGSTPIPLMTVGSTNSGAQPSTGTLNLTGGSLDVIATEFNVARHFANAGGTNATGTVTMPNGTVIADTLALATKTNTSGAPTLTGTFNQSGGTVTAGSLLLGANGNAEAPNLIANYNLTGGTLSATTISGSGATFGASTVRNLTVNGGTLANKTGGSLTITGVDATTQGRLNVIAGAGGGTLSVESSRAITFGANAILSGSGALAKNGAGTLNFNAGTTHSYNGTLTLNNGLTNANASMGSAAITVAGGTLGGAGSVGAITLTSGTVAPGNSIGTLSGTSLAWNAGALMSFELSNTDNTSDRLSVTGLFDKVGTGSYVFDFGGTGAQGFTYTLVTFATDQTDFVQTDFSYTNLGTGLTGSFLQNSNSLQFQVIPEPATWAAIAGVGALGLALLRRRRS